MAKESTEGIQQLALSKADSIYVNCRRYDTSWYSYCFRSLLSEDISILDRNFRAEVRVCHELGTAVVGRGGVLACCSGT